MIVGGFLLCDTRAIRSTPRLLTRILEVRVRTMYGSTTWSETVAASGLSTPGLKFFDMCSGRTRTCGVRYAKAFSLSASMLCFWGYSSDHPDGCYDFLNCETGSLIQSRDVVFDERSVTVPETEQYLLTEGTRSLPEWMEFNPFAPEGTGPDGHVAEVVDAPTSQANFTG